jgi:hypothetical protein
MEIINKEFYKTNVTLRITALWAFSESFLGGILHGLKLPFSGLVLAFIASVCITLIAIGNGKKGEILKATLLVIAIKFILSPHTPPMAYLAVLVQGAAGELLFLNKKFIKPAAFTLTLFSLVYSALQQLLILTILFGKNFWQAVDIFLNKITQSFTHSPVHYSLYLVLFYLSCYLIVGILGGIFNISIINKTAIGNDTSLLLQKIKALPTPAINIFENKETQNKKWFKILLGFLMVLLLILSYLPFISDKFAKFNFAEIFIRGIIIICVWLYFITPLLQYQIKKWLHKYKVRNSNTIQQIMILFPAIKLIIQQSWLVSKQNKLRVKNFIYNTVLLIVHNEE